MGFKEWSSFIICMPNSKDGNNEQNIRNNYKSKESQIDALYQ